MAKRNIDWEKIEVDYRTGIKTLREIASEHNITHGAINRRAKRDNWSRDLSAKIQAAAKAKVSKAQVSSLVSKTTEKEVVEVESEIQSRIQIAHRSDIRAIRKLVMQLFEELGDVTVGRDIVSEIYASIEDGQTSNALKKLSGLPGRVDIVKKLTESLKSLVALERQAFGLDDNFAPTDGLFNAIVRTIVDPKESKH